MTVKRLAKGGREITWYLPCLASWAVDKPPTGTEDEKQVRGTCTDLNSCTWTWKVDRCAHMDLEITATVAS